MLISKETHEFMPVKKAQELALEYLKILGIEDIANRRVINCSSSEIFYVLLIRAMMMPQKSILLQTPYSIISNLGDIKTILCNISKLENFKTPENNWQYKSRSFLVKATCKKNNSNRREKKDTSKNRVTSIYKIKY